MSTTAISTNPSSQAPAFKELEIGDLIKVSPPNSEESPGSPETPQGTNYVVRAIQPGEIYISTPGYPDDINKLVSPSGEVDTSSLEGWVVFGAEDYGYTARRLHAEVEKEYTRASLVNALLEQLTAGTSKKVTYEMRNTLERWILSLYNEYEFPFELLPVPTDDRIKEHFLKEILKIRPELDGESVYAQLQETIDQYNQYLSQMPENTEVIVDDNQASYREMTFPMTDRLKYLLTNWPKETVMRMLLRYQSVLSGSQQWGIPWPVMDVLYRLGFRNEGFASPLNSRFIDKPGTTFGSLFLDTDAPFGSYGRFGGQQLALFPGGWIINSPFVEEIFESSRGPILEYLDSSDEARVFVLMPLWDDVPLLTDLSEHPKLVAKEIMQPGSFYYQDPDQVVIKPPRGSAVYFILGQPLAEDELILIRQAWQPPMARPARGPRTTGQSYPVPVSRPDRPSGQSYPRPTSRPQGRELQREEGSVTPKRAVPGRSTRPVPVYPPAPTPLAERVMYDPFETNRAQLNELEMRLNGTKDLLNRDDFEKLRRQYPHETAIVRMRQNLTKEYGAEGSSKAWIKMWEILHLPSVEAYLTSLPEVKTFFNAELPGGFLFATNHFFSNRGILFNWVFSSYYPQKAEGKDFLGDSHDLVQKHPRLVLMGLLTTTQGQVWSDGDLTNPKMPALLTRLAKSRLGSIDLYTADGGFNVTGKENLQERLSIKLIFGEAETGLRVLDIGGVFVLKMFTFFTAEMLSLLLVLFNLFEDAQLFKPLSSGPLNSEIYFVGVGYKGASEDVLNRIHQGLTGERQVVSLPADIRPQVKEYLLQTLISTSQKQIQQIEVFLNNPRYYEGLTELSNIIADVQPLAPEHKLL